MTSTNSVSSLFPADTGFHVDKVLAVATGSGSDHAVALASMSTLRPAIEQFRSTLNGRGMEGNDMTENALYIIDRAAEYINGSATAPPEKDLYLMARNLKPLIEDMKIAAKGIDREEKAEVQ
ncbi:hypothetical protein [Arthrobacter sp. UYEF21]|uniref:hypothetical protein n=1 Tax=Arthrobacter sp. UYEF21 TaxID=1756364 RepID=UPI003399DB87